MPEQQTLLTGLVIGESQRWHEDRLWFSNRGAQEVIAVDLEGDSQVEARVPTTIPFCIDWLPDGSLLVVGPRRCCYAGSLTGRWLPRIVALVIRDGVVRQVADGIEFGNGMAVTPHNLTLIVAESFGSRLTAFDIARDGSLSNRRVCDEVADRGPAPAHSRSASVGATECGNRRRHALAPASRTSLEAKALPRSSLVS